MNDELRANEAEQTRLTKIIEAVKSESAATPFVEKLTSLDAQLVEMRVAKTAAAIKLDDARDMLVKAGANPLGGLIEPILRRQTAKKRLLRDRILKFCLKNDELDSIPRIEPYQKNRDLLQFAAR